MSILRGDKTMTATINKIEADLLRFIVERGREGISRIELKEQYKLDSSIIIIALVKLVKLGLIEEESARIKTKDGNTLVTKIVKARVTQ
jgi:predicted transcriptional regulator